MKLPIKRKKAVRRERVFEIDFLRGICIFLVVAYHFCYDLTLVPEVFSNYYQVVISYPFIGSSIAYVNSVLYTDYMEILVLFFAGLLLFITGISCTFSHNNLFRGVRIFFFGLLITAATVTASEILGENLFISFGILHCIGFSIIIYGIADIIFRKLKIDNHASLWFYLGLIFIVTGIFLNLYSAIINCEVENIKDYFSVMFGFSSESTDWFPIFPFTGVVFLGIAFGKFFYSKKQSYIRLNEVSRKILSPISFFGRHTLSVYVIHQVIIILVFIVTFVSLGFRF